MNPEFCDKYIKLNWHELWIKKSENIEKYFNKIKGKYQIIDESINYYISILEMGIYFLREYDNYYDYGYLQHKIIIDEIYCDKNNFKIDVKEREIAEYLKCIFFKRIYSLEKIHTLIQKVNKKINYKLVIARLLMPNYYFYFVEKLIFEDRDNPELYEIVDRIKEYEEYIKTIVDEINKINEKKIVLPF